MDGWSDSEIEQSIRQLQEAHTWPGAKASTPTLAASNAARGAATAKPRMTSSLKSNGGMCVSAAVLQEFRTQQSNFGRISVAVAGATAVYAD